MNQTIVVLSHEILQLKKSINRYRRIVRELEVENNELKAQVKDLKEQIGDEPFCEQVDKWLHGGAPQECKECAEGKYRELTGELENPLHIGESRYGEDGTEWHVTGFRWDSSHPVQGVDDKGRRRDLKPEWLRSERPDSLGSLLEDVRRGALAYPRDRITGYLEDNHSIGEAVLLDVRDRIEKLAGGSE